MTPKYRMIGKERVRRSAKITLFAVITMLVVAGCEGKRGPGRADWTTGRSRIGRSPGRGRPLGAARDTGACRAATGPQGPQGETGPACSEGPPGAAAGQSEHGNSGEQILGRWTYASDNFGGTDNGEHVGLSFLPGCAGLNGCGDRGHDV